MKIRQYAERHKYFSAEITKFDHGLHFNSIYVLRRMALPRTLHAVSWSLVASKVAIYMGVSILRR